MKLDKIIKKRRENANYITKRLEKHLEIRLPIPPDTFEHIYQFYTIRLKNSHVRNDLHNFLTKKQIFSKVYFDPIHLSAFYKTKFGFKEGDLPITETIASQVLTIPVYPNMTLEEKNYLINSISEFFETKL